MENSFVEEPWIVLEYLPHGDLKKFLKVSTTRRAATNV